MKKIIKLYKMVETPYKYKSDPEKFVPTFGCEIITGLPLESSQIIDRVPRAEIEVGKDATIIKYKVKDVWQWHEDSDNADDCHVVTARYCKIVIGKKVRAYGWEIVE